uniref:Uncharacterized protein n=1 Tax=Megaselia scalaris TaxID=36166 RepID=T1H0D4_MEGSC
MDRLLRELGLEYEYFEAVDGNRFVRMLSAMFGNPNNWYSSSLYLILHFGTQTRSYGHLFDLEKNALDIQFSSSYVIDVLCISQNLDGFLLVDHVGCRRVGRPHDHFQEDIEIAALSITPYNL